MTINGINLASSLVLTARQRRLIYRAMLWYFLFASLLLVLAASRATRAVQDGLDLKRQSQALQKRFKARYPDQPGMEAYAGLLTANLQKKADQAAAVNTALPTNLYSTISLLNLLADPTVQGSRMNTLSFEKVDGKPELVFSVMVPQDTGGEGADSPAFLQKWRKDPVLVKEFTAITPVTTERGSVGNEKVSIRKYKAIFRE